MSRRRIEQQMLDRFAGGLVEFLAKHNVSPMALTLSAFALALAASITYFFASIRPLLYILAGILLIISSFFDAIDGAVARRLGKASDLGAFIDSTMDKLGESAVLIAVTASGAVDPLWGALALAFSIMVSYVRHRAEPLGVSLKGVGFMERAERLILLVAATFLEPFLHGALQAAIILIAVFAAFTVTYRIVFTVRRLIHRLS